MSLLIWSATSTVLAQEAALLRQQIKPSGLTHDIVISPNDTATRTVELWFASKGNESMPITVHVDGPPGVKAQVKSTYLAKGSAAAALENSKGWWAQALTQSGENKEKLIHTIRATGAAYSSADADMFGGGYCSLLPESEIQMMIQLLSGIYGRPMTREEICGSGNSDGGGNTNGQDYSDGRSIHASGLLQKDTCRNGKKGSYLVKVALDLNSVDAALFSSGFNLQASVTLTPYRDSRAAKLKAVSDGKFYPNSILLMPALGSYFAGGEEIRQVKWNKKGPGKPKFIKVSDYIFYRGKMLSRSPISGLNGGKATFEVTNGSRAYSVCFSLVKRDQLINGYTN